jgi:secondary thiamine-phosphate synthase enzyme
MVSTHTISFKTSGDGHIVDLTPQIREHVQSCEMQSGTVTVFVPGSTAGLTTIEFEPGLQRDVPAVMEKLIPSNVSYQHDETWHDGNGFSHLRAALIGPDITIPFVERELQLGTWQQVVFLEFDNRARSRRLVLQIMGE